MSILSRLCRYVHTYGYSASPVEPPLGILKKHSRAHSRRNLYARACLEEMEPRVLLTTLTSVAGQPTTSYAFQDFSNKDFTVTLHGNITVDLYGAQFGDNGLQMVDLIPATDPAAPIGVDIFAMYIEQSDINSFITVTGKDIYTGGISGFYTGDTDPGFPITAPTGAGQIYIGQYANGTPISNIPNILVPNAGVMTQAAQNLAISNNGVDNQGNFIAGIYSANSIGKILIDGTITGGVNITGSVGTFYAGWLITGDVTDGGNLYPDNFSISGDVGSLLVRTDVGTNVTTIPKTDPFYDTNTEIHVGGKIGTFTIGGGAVDSLTVDNLSSATSLSSLGFTWTEPTTYLLPNNQGARVGTFETGTIPILTAADPFFNPSFATATYVGTLDLTNGFPSINLNGTIQGFIGGQTPNPVDYYAFGALAGQTFTVNLTAEIGVNAILGVFDPDGRLIFSGVVNASGLASATITADRPGAYRVAVGLPGDRSLTGAASLFTDYSYSLGITGVSDMAIGGVHTFGDMLSEGDGITATSGDIGALVSTGQFLSDTPSSINVNAGNLLAVEGATIGNIPTGFLANYPTITVNGEIGLIHGATLLIADVFATNDIQILDSEGDFEGTFISNDDIGIIRAGSMIGASNAVALGQTLFQVNADGLGVPGDIDLIDVTGDLGSLANGGPRFDTGLDGNIRFMQVGGSIYQDPAFGGGGTGTAGSIYGDGGLVYAAGQVVTLTDDSGSKITLTPAPAQTITTITNTGSGNITTITTIPGGQLTTYTYGIYGTGGVVVVKVVSTGSLTIGSSSENISGQQSAEIGDIYMTGAGMPLITTIVGGKPVTITNPDGTTTTTIVGGTTLPANFNANNTANGTGNGTANTTITLNILNIVGSIPTSIFKVNASGTLNTLTDSTGGDLINLATGDIGNLTVNGNIGSTSDNTGAILNQAAVVSNAYPFVEQHIGATVGNVVSISATGSIGNIVSSGSIGSITPDSGGGAVKGTLEGITGPIMAAGNIGTVNIGNGIATDGFSPVSTTASYGGAMSQAGIYADGTIVSVTGNNADIRGQIISTDQDPFVTDGPSGILSISLTNGSLIGAEIGVYTTLQMASFINGGGVTLPGGSGIVTNPSYPIQNISISGNGGIIGTLFEAANIGSVTVASTGFGVINSAFVTPAGGTLKSISAGGFGIRQVSFTGANIDSLIATGDGSVAAVAQYSDRVRNSEGATIDPYTGYPITSDTDLTKFMADAGLGDADYRTGIIGNSSFIGQNLGNLTAFTIEGASVVGGDTLDFANSIGSIKLASGVSDIRIISGGVANFTIGGDASGLDLEVAGPIGTMLIAGNFLNGSLIFAKGPSSSIKSLTVAGNFDGTLISQGYVASLVIGSAGKKNTVGSGNFTGTVELLGGSSAKSLTFNSGFSGDFEISGSVSSVTFKQGLAPTSALTVNGNLGKLTVGGDKVTNLGLAGNVVVQGTLGQLIGSGGFTGSITTTANISKVQYTGTMSGSITAGGSIGAFTLKGGDLAGAVLAAGSIGPIKITGNLASTGSFTSTGGAISAFTINKGGTFSGSLTATSIKTLTVQGNTSGGSLNIGGAINSINIAGSILGTQIIASNIGKLTVKGDIGAGSTIFQSGTGASTITVKGAINGNVLTDGAIKNLTASSLSHAVITAGQTISSLKIKGGVASSIIQSGITPGADGVFTAGNTATLGTLGKISFGSLTNSVVAAGGAINIVTSGALVDSSISSGLVLDPAAIAAVIAGTNPLATPTDVQTLRANPTLFFGNINSVNIANGAEGGLDADSNVTAGVSPGPNGIFGDPSDGSIPASAVGTSTIIKTKIAADELSQVIAHDPA